MALIGSFAQLFILHPQQAVDWIKAAGLGAEQRKPLIYSLWYAGLGDAAQQLARDDRWHETAQQQLAGSAPALSQLSLTKPADVGLLWGAYRISGDAIYIQHLIQLLLRHEAGNRTADKSIVSVIATSLNRYRRGHEQAESQFESVRKQLSAANRLTLDLLVSEHTADVETVDCD